MSWSLDKEVLEDGDGTSITRIFLTINGKKAVCPYNGEELGHIISADHGHNAHSVWISFEGSKNGKRLDRNLFDANKGTFANLFSNCSSNASFLEILKKAGVGKRRRQDKTKGKSKPCGRATIPEVVVESRNIETDTFIKDLKIGEYTVSINQLTEPDEQYLCRKIKSSWVETLKEKLRVIPDTVCTIIPVMICPNEISKIEDFKEEDVPLYSFWTLGGNHIVKAIKELNEESENPRISTIRVHVYVALTIKEAIRVGNEHNKSAKTLDWTLQDQILQARKLEERNARSICIMLQEMGCKDNIQTNSMSMMTFAANLCEECFDVLKLLFDAFESVYGPQKSFPSSFIKSLQGLQAGAIMTYLRQALGDVSKLFEIKKEIERSKRMKIIKQVFVSQTDCTDWEEACEVYPDFTCRIDEFADLNFSRKFVPAVILNFCQEAKAGVAAEDIEIELKIKFKGKEIDDSNLINKLKRKITSEVKKSKKWRADISFDSEHVSSQKEMTLSDFKFIFYMEWGHRMWGRMVGMVFLVPAGFFLYKGWISKALKPRLLVLTGLLGFQGFLGWYMVKSGLQDQPKDTDIPRVSQYRLASHLGSAFLLYTLFLWQGLNKFLPYNKYPYTNQMRNIRMGAFGIKALVFTTALSGAFVAGLDAGLTYNSWPKMADRWIPDDLLALDPKWKNTFENPTTVQFNHRHLAESTVLAIAGFWWMCRKAPLPPRARMALNCLLGMSLIQATLGITTLLTYVPTPLAASHQSGSLVLLSIAIWLCHELRRLPK